MLENLRIERQRMLVGFEAFLVSLAGEFGCSQIAINRGGIGINLQSLAVLTDCPAIVFLGVVNGPKIVNRFGVFWIHFDGLLIMFLGIIELHQLVMSDADL